MGFQVHIKVREWSIAQYYFQPIEVQLNGNSAIPLTEVEVQFLSVLKSELKILN